MKQYTVQRFDSKNTSRTFVTEAQDDLRACLHGKLWSMHDYKTVIAREGIWTEYKNGVPTEWSYPKGLHELARAERDAYISKMTA